MFDLAKKNIIKVKNLEVSLKNQVKNKYKQYVRIIKHEKDMDAKFENVESDIEKVINSNLRKYDEKSKNIKAEIEEENIEKKSKIALYLLFSDVIKFDINKVKERIESITDKDTEIKISDIFQDSETNNICGDIFIGRERIEFIGYDIPLPKEISDLTIKFTHVEREEIENMQNHNYYIAAYYQGKSKDYNVIFNLYAKLAYGFCDYNFVGMANKYSCNVLSPSLITNLFENEELADKMTSPKSSIWRNLIEVPCDDGMVWYVTKGNNIINIHEFAFKGENIDYKKAHSLFNYLFNYEYLGKQKIKVGTKMEVGQEAVLKFKKPYELQKVLSGIGKETIVVERIEK